MKESLTPYAEASSPAVGRRINQACNDFEAAWKAGAVPRIEDRLSDWDEPERTALVRELIYLDLSYRRRAGDECLVEDYLARFPLLDGDWLVGALADEAWSSGGDSTPPAEPGSPPSRTPNHAFEYESMAPTAAENYDFLAPPQNPGELGRLGPYVVLKVLGAGGMGVVFQAHDPQLERLVALKAMLPALTASASARQRFLREAKATAAINHDHIVTIYQVGEDRGAPFLAMEFLEGEPLSARLKREGRLPVREVLRIGREIADGLDAAHQHGLIHRDVKPANIWLEGDRRRVKILDFGLARAVADGAHLTRQGAIVGTPAYMAPEQVAGRPVDVRGDLFSLGCVLYRMAAGVLPFKGNDAISMLLAVSTESPTLPLKLNPDLPAPVSALVMRLLAKKADDRPPSARAVVEAIQAIEKRLTLFQEGVNSATVSVFDAVGMADVGKTATAVMPAGVARPRRGWLVWAVTAVAALILLGLMVYWCGPAIVRYATDKGELVIEIDDPEVKVMIDQQKGVTIHDKAHEGAPFLLTPGRHDLTTGEYEVEVTETGGVHLFTKEFTITRGGVTSVKVKCEPAAVVRKRLGDLKYNSMRASAAEKALIGLLDLKADSKVNMDQLRVEIAEFQRKHAGTPQALEAAKLLERMPSPLDALNQDGIPPYELAEAGGGDPKAAPSELVAVLGDSRLRHTSWASTVVFTPDGKKLISGGVDGVVKVWDVANGEVLQTIDCCKNSRDVWGYTHPAISPDGLTSAIWGAGPEVRLWDLETGKEGRTLGGHTDQIYHAAFSHDGKTLASASADGSVRIWDRATGEVRHTLWGRKGWSDVFSFSPDDKTLTRVFEDRTILTWNAVGGGEPTEANTGHIGQPSFDGKMTATLYEQDLTVKVLDASTGKEKLDLGKLNYTTRCAGFSQDGRQLATGGMGGELKVWSLDTGKMLQNLSYSDSISILSVAFSADGRLLASAGDDERVRLWDVSTGKERVSLKPGCGRLAAIAPDGRTLATLDINKVKILDMTTGRESRSLPSGNLIWRLTLNPDGRSLVSTRWDGLIQMWDLATGQAQPVGVHKGWPQALVLSPGGAMAASAASGSPEVRLWDLRTKREVNHFVHNGSVISLAFSPNGRMLAAATKDKVVKVWSTTDGREQCTLLGSRVAFSPDGPFAVAAGDAVTLYDAVSWKELRTLHRTSTEPSEPFSLAFNPSGRLVATSNDDGRVVVWNLNDDKAAPRSFWVCRPRQQDGEIAFTPEGRYLISANVNGTSYVLRLTRAPEK